jgi:hypothetical protein
VNLQIGILPLERLKLWQQDSTYVLFIAIRVSENHPKFTYTVLSMIAFFVSSGEGTNQITANLPRGVFDLEQACLICLEVVKSKSWVRVGKTDILEGELFWIRKNYTARRYYSSF